MKIGLGWSIAIRTHLRPQTGHPPVLGRPHLPWLPGWDSINKILVCSLVIYTPHLWQELWIWGLPGLPYPYLASCAWNSCWTTSKTNRFCAAGCLDCASLAKHRASASRSRCLPTAPSGFTAKDLQRSIGTVHGCGWSQLLVPTIMCLKMIDPQNDGFSFQACWRDKVI